MLIVSGSSILLIYISVVLCNSIIILLDCSTFLLLFVIIYCLMYFNYVFFRRFIENNFTLYMYYFLRVKNFKSAN